MTCLTQQTRGQIGKNLFEISNNSNTVPLLTKAFAFGMRCLWIIVVALNNIY
jgi:hypothetical protein